MGTQRVDHAHPERFAEPSHGFAWIRMIGALVVIYGHSSPLVGTGELFPPEWPVQPDEGVLMGFFAMSGFQITESWVRDPHPLRFAAKRVLRLWPPMLTVTLGMALIVGPLVTTLPVREYFAAHDTWGYVVNNAGMLTLQHTLPGVFTANPWPDAVNGSLWTLPMELLAYGGLYALLLLGAAKQRWRWLAVAALVALVVWDRHLEQIPGAESGGALLSVPVESLVAFLVAFALGVVLNLYRVPLSPTAALAGLVVLAAMPNSIAASFLMTFVASYAVVVAGHFWPSRLTVPGWFVNGSYGVYVWGFPVQQLLAMAGIANQYVMLLCAAPIAYVLGTASWVFVEDPTMKLRRYVAPDRPARAAEQRPRDGREDGDRWADEDGWADEDDRDGWDDEDGWDDREDWSDEDRDDRERWDSRNDRERWDDRDDRERWDDRDDRERWDDRDDRERWDDRDDRYDHRESGHRARGDDLGRAARDGRAVLAAHPAHAERDDLDPRFERAAAPAGPPEQTRHRADPPTHRAEPVRPEPARLEPGRPEPARPDPAARADPLSPAEPTQRAEAIRSPEPARPAAQPRRSEPTQRVEPAQHAGSTRRVDPTRRPEPTPRPEPARRPDSSRRPDADHHPERPAEPHPAEDVETARDFPPVSWPSAEQDAEPAAARSFTGDLADPSATPPRRRGRHAAPPPEAEETRPLDRFPPHRS
ncbi:acyltransferase family protein [Saccharopolyspora gregorii]